MSRPYNVDVDEADVAVLSQNLTRSKELYNDIAKSLYSITTRTSSASRTIKPVLADFNSMTRRKKSIEEGLALLQDVSAYSGKAADSQRVLSLPIDTVGASKYLTHLNQSASLLKDMKRDIHDFDGVVIGFANAVDKAEMSVISYFTKIINGVDLSSGSVPKQNDVSAVLHYFSTKGNLRSAHEAMEMAFSRQLAAKMGPYEQNCTLQKRLPAMPYERGSSGITPFVIELGKAVNGLFGVATELNVSDTPVVRNTLVDYMNNRVAKIIREYCGFLDQNGLSGQDLPLLDIIDNLNIMEAHLADVADCSFSVCKNADHEYRRLISTSQGLLTEWVKYIDHRVSSIDKYNEISIPEVVVEVVSKIRRLADYRSIPSLMEGIKLGSWLDVKPPLRFISVYTSVMPGAEAQAQDRNLFLISSFISDLFDELMVSLEINLKDQAGDDIKKSTQGFLLVKNVVMMENIINRSEGLYQVLGTIGMDRLHKLKSRFMKLFLDDWNYASYIIIRDMTQITTTNAQHGGQYSNKEKEQIKELFRNFNEAFEEALKNYEKFNIQEKDLRRDLSNEIKKLIINAYNKLYDKYGSGEFTKNRTKYIKYDKMQFERLLHERL